MFESIIVSSSLRVIRAAAETQLLLHCEPQDADAIAGACGLVLPAKMLSSATSGGWSSLHLAPDEWLLVGTGDGSALTTAVHAAGKPLSLVEISDRSVALEVSGDDMPGLLAGGCPIDIAVLDEGTCTRTMFGKVMVMLWLRDDRLRISYARSYDDYVVELVRAIAADLGVEQAIA